MKTLTSSIVLLAFSLLPSFAQAQNRDWNALLALRPGAAIKVYADKNVHCDFDYVTDEVLVCQIPRHNSFFIPAPPFSFSRAQVREVHLEHPKANAAIGALVGGIFGAAVMMKGTVFARDRRAAGLIGGVGGGALGGEIGQMIPVIRGTVIYKR
jgi:hypothetical protein